MRGLSPRWPLPQAPGLRAGSAESLPQRLRGSSCGTGKAADFETREVCAVYLHIMLGASMDHCRVEGSGDTAVPDMIILLISELVDGENSNVQLSNSH